MAHWEYILVAASGPAAFAVWRLARVLLLVVGALTKNKQINRQCERMLMLTRRDAPKLLKIQTNSADEADLPPAEVDPVEADASSPANALEAVTDHHVRAS